MHLGRRILTDAEAIGDAEQELVEEREEVVVHQVVIVTRVVVRAHHGNRDEEDESREEKEEEGVSVEYVGDLGSVFTNSVTDVVHEEDEDHRPASVKAFDLLVQGWAREEDKSYYEGEHDDKVVGKDVLASLEQGLEVVLPLDTLLLDRQCILGCLRFRTLADHR